MSNHIIPTDKLAWDIFESTAPFDGQVLPLVRVETHVYPIIETYFVLFNNTIDLACSRTRGANFVYEVVDGRVQNAPLRLFLTSKNADKCARRLERKH